MIEAWQIILGIVIFIILVWLIFRKKIPKKKGWLIFQRKESDNSDERTSWFAQNKNTGQKTPLFESSEKLMNYIRS